MLMFVNLKKKYHYVCEAECVQWSRTKPYMYYLSVLHTKPAKLQQRITVRKEKGKFYLFIYLFKDLYCDSVLIV